MTDTKIPLSKVNFETMPDKNPDVSERDRIMLVIRRLDEMNGALGRIRRDLTQHAREARIQSIVIALLVGWVIVVSFTGIVIAL